VCELIGPVATALLDDDDVGPAAGITGASLSALTFNPTLNSKESKDQFTLFWTKVNDRDRDQGHRDQEQHDQEQRDQEQRPRGQLCLLLDRYADLDVVVGCWSSGGYRIDVDWWSNVHWWSNRLANWRSWRSHLNVDGDRLNRSRRGR
jgi:hypothetical protein